MYGSRVGESMAMEYSEMDPSGRYGRFNEILGRGAMKTVYKAFDEVLGMEVAWNQVNIVNVFRTPEALQMLHTEIHLLKKLDHDSILRYHESWYDEDYRNFNFITEMFTSGTLREYRQKYKRVHIGAIKNWARQILRGLVYMHGLDPRVVHRDLKCDNIFINGHLGQVKIGDFGLAAILRGPQHAHSLIGTPEFMAPEVYEEDYDVPADIYAFGMCMLEMLTSEFPYNECFNETEIANRVTSGMLPNALYRIEDVEAQRFVRKCLEPVSRRASAQELLMDPFLTIIAATAADNNTDEYDEDDGLQEEDDGLQEEDEGLLFNSISEARSREYLTPNGELENSLPTRSIDMMITGTMNPEDEDDVNIISLKVKITFNNGEARNINFPFDTGSDTAMEVAIEMVRELKISDWEPSEIAQMIDEEISALVPTWNNQGLDSMVPRFNHQRQQSFNYGDGEDDNDDNDNQEEEGTTTNRTRNPFYSLSSPSISSLASLPGLDDPSSSAHAHNHATIVTTPDHDEWLHQEDCVFEEDGRSESSSSISSSLKFYYSLGGGHEMEDSDSSSSPNNKRGDQQQQQQHLASTSKPTRFGPQEEETGNTNKSKSKSKSKSKDKELLNNDAHHHHHHHRRPFLRRVTSLSDMRSRARSLADKLYKGRLFKTVDAVESIGFHHPPTP